MNKTRFFVEFGASMAAYVVMLIASLLLVSGGMVTGDAESYQYLVESIRRFPPPAAFARMIEEAGFKRVTHRTLTAGVVAIHSGWKI